MRDRSTSEVIFRNIRRSQSWTDTLPMHRQKFSVSLQNSDQNLLSLPKMDDIQRRFSNYSDGDVPENPFFNLDTESSEENEVSKLTSLKKLPIKKQIIGKTSEKQTKPLPPIVAVIPPEEDILFLTR